jgi:putative ABC transport system permease protein
LKDGIIFPTGVRRINGWWWDVDGSWIDDVDKVSSNTNECMIGKSVSKKLNLKQGDMITVTYDEKTTINLNVSGIISTGGDEDNQIFVPLIVAQSLSDRTNSVHTVQISALCTGCPIEDIAIEIEAAMTSIEAKTILQMTNAEMGVLQKIEAMMTIVTIIALFTTILGVSTTLTASVLERKTEIGLLKSIGADTLRLLQIFILESVLIGIVGGILGFGVGIIGAQFVGILVFDSLIAPQLLVLPIVVIISCIIALFASVLPIRSAMKINPVLVLGGIK